MKKVTDRTTSNIPSVLIYPIDGDKQIATCCLVLSNSLS